MGETIINKFISITRIMEYIKYLLKNKTRLLFVLFVNVFTLPLLIFLFSNYEYVVDESSEFVFFVLTILTILISILGNYQPYKEWKDGLNRKP
jgi:hypothetical protein